MTQATVVDVALSVAALATSILTLLTAVIGVAVAIRELRKNTRITTSAARTGDATHSLLADVVHNGGVAGEPTPIQDSGLSGHEGGGNGFTRRDTA